MLNVSKILRECVLWMFQVHFSRPKFEIPSAGEGKHLSPHKEVGCVSCTIGKYWTCTIGCVYAQSMLDASNS